MRGALSAFSLILLVVFMGGVLADSADAAIFLSSLNQDTDPNSNAILGNNPTTATKSISRLFTTGNHSPGFVLTDVKVLIHTSSSSRNAVVSIYTAWPGTSNLRNKLYELSGSVSASGNRIFKAPHGAVLDRNTNYYVHIQVGSGSGTFQVGTTDDTGVDSHEAGWSMSDKSRYARNDGVFRFVSGGLKIQLIGDNRSSNLEPTGKPSIEGTVQIGETLTVDTSGIGDPNSVISASFSYQWVRIDEGVETDISGADGSSYTVVDADVGKHLKVRVVFFDGHGYRESVVSDVSGVRDALGNAPPFGKPTIIGTVELGDTLTVNTSGIDDDDGVPNPFSYQWVRIDGGVETDISGADGISYTVVDADVGTHLKVRVVFFDGQGYRESVVSDVSGVRDALGNAPPFGKPTIIGTVELGDTLTVDTSGVSDSNGLNNVDFAYQWVRVGTTEIDILGATGSTYTPVVADSFKHLKVEVSFIDDGGFSEGPLVSDLTDVVLGVVLVSNLDQALSLVYPVPQISVGAQPFTTGNDAASYFFDGIGLSVTKASTSHTPLVSIHHPDVSDDDVPGEKLYDLNGSVTSTGTRFFRAPLGVFLNASTKYFLVVDSVTANGTFSDSFEVARIDSDDNGGFLSGWSIGDTWVISHDNGAVWSTTYSPLKCAVYGRGNNFVTSGKPVITGNVRVGRTLFAGVSGIEDRDGLPDFFDYQWVRVDNGVETDIPGASHSIYVPVSDDAGKRLKVKVSFTDGGGFSEGPLFSDLTGVVLGVVLVSNLDQLRQGINLPHQSSDLFGAQPFTTGGGVDFYFFDGAGIFVTRASKLSVPLVSIHYPDVSNDSLPGEKLYDLDGSVTSKGTRFFRAPLGAFLNASTKYFLVVDEGNETLSVTNRFRSGGTSSYGNDEGSLPGWSIGDTWMVYASTDVWVQRSGALRVGVYGRGNNFVTSGKPVITGNVRVGRTLFAGVSGIEDRDGLPDFFDYQWVRVDNGVETDIPGASHSIYVPVSDDAGKRLKVKVSFTDGGGFSEGPLFSDLTGVVMVEDVDHGTRLSDHDLSVGVSRPANIWSDGVVMYVANESDNNRIYAFAVSDGRREVGREFTSLHNKVTILDGLWSDGTYMWVINSPSNDDIFAYRMSDMSRASGEDINLDGLSHRNDDPVGMWSDGQTMWVLDGSKNKFFAYHMSNKSHDPERTFDLAGVNGDPVGVWSDGHTIWVADGFDQKLYAYVLSDGSRDSGKDLNLTVTPVDIWSDGQVMWVANSNESKLYAYAIDTNPSFNNALGLWGNEILRDLSSSWNVWSDGRIMWVLDSVQRKVYAYRVSDKSRVPGEDIDVTSVFNSSTRGMWSDGVTMWISGKPLPDDNVSDQIYAFRMSDKSRDSGKDFKVADGTEPHGFWSDGQTLWVASSTLRNRIFAFRMSDQSLDSSKSFTNLSPLNDGGFVYGVWSDGRTMWASDIFSSYLYAFSMSDKSWDSSRDLNLTNSFSGGMWSDGRVVWVTDPNVSLNGRIYDYEFPASFVSVSAPFVSSVDFEVGFTEVNVSVNIGNIAFVTNPTIYYRFRESGGSWVDSSLLGSFKDISGGSVAFTLANLMGDTDYDFEVSFDDGFPAFSTERTGFTTLDGGVPSVPAAPSVSSPSSSSLFVSWSAPVNTSPSITDYYVQYSVGGSGSFIDWSHSGNGTNTTITDLDADTFYDVRVLARNAEGDSGWSPVSSATTLPDQPPPPTNNPPFFTSGSSFSVNENDRAVGVVVADDSDLEDSVTGYSLSGADVFRFFILSDGVLTLRSALDYEVPVAVGGDNVYNLVVTAYSGKGGRVRTATQNLMVMVDDVDESPSVPVPFLSSPSSTSLFVSWSAPVNTGPVITDYDVQYRRGNSGSFVDWSHSGNGTNTTITDLDAGVLYGVRVLARNAEGDSVWSPVSSFTTGSAVINHNPVFTSDSSFSVNENDRAVGVVVADDSDLEDSVIGYNVSGGVDLALFEITDVGVLTFVSVPDYEDPVDVGGDNVYVFEVEVRSGVGSRLRTATQTITVIVDDVDEVPSRPPSPFLSSPSSTSLFVSWSAPVNTGPVITDYDVEYRVGSSGSFVDWSHSGNGTNATITDLDAGVLYDVRVLARNAEGDSSWSSVSSFTIGDVVVNDNPVFTSGSSFSVNENVRAVGVVGAYDSDSEDSVTGYRISGGADSILFEITDVGVLTFVSAPDYEDPSDVGRDNVYVFEVEVRSGVGSRLRTATQTITVTVNDVVEGGPVDPPKEVVLVYRCS